MYSLVMALSTAGGWIGILGALMITGLIVFVSGVPPAERRAAHKLGWNRYKKIDLRFDTVVPRALEL